MSQIDYPDREDAAMYEALANSYPTGTRRRSDGRLEVADNEKSNDLYGCKRDDWCILADGHQGDCNDDREVWVQ